MYLRIRVRDKMKLIPGEETLMVAETKNPQGVIVTKPGILEWWDGITWNPVKIVAEDDTSDPE